MSHLTIRDLTAQHIGRKVRLTLRGGEVVHVGTLSTVTHHPTSTAIYIDYASGATWSSYRGLSYEEREFFTLDHPIELVEEFDL